MDDIFDTFDEAVVGGGGLYLTPGGSNEDNWDDRPPGVYTLEILDVISKKSRKKQNLFIVEFRIHESDVKHRKTGSKVSWVVDLGQDAAMGNIKGFLAAAMGEEAENVKKQDLLDALSDEQPLNGMQVRCTVLPIRTKANKPFSKHTWEPVS